MREIVERWHAVVNGRDLVRVPEVVTDPVTVSGPRGSGPITRAEFAEWIERSGIELRPISWHPAGAGVVVVEQEARWPAAAGPVRVATVFEVTGGRVSAALRFPSLDEALGHAVAGTGQALFRFVRHWSRRQQDHGRDVLVAEAVHALRDRAEVTVNDVAAELGLDQSGASRMVAHAAEAGYLTVAPSRWDARRRVLALTGSGSELIEAAHRWQDETFAELTAGWTDGERVAFRHAMTRLIG